MRSTATGPTGSPTSLRPVERRSQPAPAANRPNHHEGASDDALLVDGSKDSTIHRLRPIVAENEHLLVGNDHRGLYYKLESKGLVERICSEDDITHAIDNAPTTTRARLRGEFIKRAKAKKRDYTVDWVHLKLNDQAQRTVLCKDPFKSRDERVEKIIESM